MSAPVQEDEVPSVADLPPNQYTSSDGVTFLIHDPPDGLIDIISPASPRAVQISPKPVTKPAMLVPPRPRVSIVERANRAMARVREEALPPIPEDHVHALPDAALDKWDDAEFACSCDCIFRNQDGVWVMVGRRRATRR